MSKTTKAQIVSKLRRDLWLRSKERGSALKRDNYSCVDCGVKQSKAKGYEQKVEVHHKDGIANWDAIVDAIQTHLLCDPDDLETLCPECHALK